MGNLMPVLFTGNHIKQLFGINERTVLCFIDSLLYQGGEVLKCHAGFFSMSAANRKVPGSALKMFHYMTQMQSVPGSKQDFTC